MQNVSAATPSGGDPGRPPAGAAAARHTSDTLPAVTRTLATYAGLEGKFSVYFAAAVAIAAGAAGVRQFSDDGVLIADAGRAS